MGIYIKLCSLLILFIIHLDTTLADRCNFGQTKPKDLFEKCSCTYKNGLATEITEITCKKAGLVNILVPVRQLPNLDSVEKLVISQNKFPHSLTYANAFCASHKNGATTPKFKNLKHLDLSDNHIQMIDEHAFQCLPSLETLILDNNNWHLYNLTKVFKPVAKTLKRLHLQNVFSKTNKTLLMYTMYQGTYPLMDVDFPVLEDLILGKNHLRVFDSNAFCRMPKIETVVLSHNHLLHLDFPDKCDTYLRTMRYLHLEYNNLDTVKPHVVEKIEKFTNIKIFMKHNKFNCDCGIVAFTELLIQNKTKGNVNFVDAKGMNCTKPRINNGTFLLNLNTEDLHCHTLTMSGNHKTGAVNVIFGLLICAVLVFSAFLAYANRDLIRKKLRKLGGARGVTGMAKLRGYSAVGEVGDVTAA